MGENYARDNELCRVNTSIFTTSLRGRRLKGKGEGVLGKGVLGARETRGAREGGVIFSVSKPQFFLSHTNSQRSLDADVGENRLRDLLKECLCVR